MPSATLDQLSEDLLKFAQEALNADGEFRPFGATIDGVGQLQYYAADDDSESQDFRSQIESLKTFLREIAESEQIEAAGVCFDVLLHREGLPKQDAIRCCLEHADGEVIERITPYSKAESGVLRYGESDTTDGQREIFGFVGMVLRLENGEPVHSPTIRQMGAAVESLTPRGGPGFLILEGPNEDYAQVAGGDGMARVLERGFQALGRGRSGRGCWRGGRNRDQRLRRNRS